MATPNHVIVIMFENRSFDHMLGFVPGPGDLTGEEFNLVDPTNPVSERIPVTNTVGPITEIDPGHSFEDTAVQLFGRQGETDPAPMNGFVADYLVRTAGNVDAARTIMECHTADTSPVLSRLATTYCACNRWFSAVPGPTWPNRFYVHAATSAGLVTNVRMDPSTSTIFDKLIAKDRSWRVYAGDVPLCLTIDSILRRFVEEAVDPFGYHHFQPLAELFADLKHGSLPNYVFIEPHYFETSLWQSTDEHPPHDIRHGEALLSEVATALATSDYWEGSLLVVLYDEHGGFYDKVSPPTGVVNPDGRMSVSPPFDFTRLGARIPAVLISPWIEPGTVDSTVYDHSSVPATLNKLFGLGADSFLGARDAAANTFEKNLTRASARPPGELQLASAVVGPSLSEIATIDLDLRSAIGLVLKEVETTPNPLSDLQLELVDMVRTALPHLIP